MPIYKIPCAVLPVLAHAIATLPEGIPNRWVKITSYMREFGLRNEAVMSSTPIAFGISGKEVSINFTNHKDLKSLYVCMKSSPRKNVCITPAELSTQDQAFICTGLNPIVLIPKETTCTCGGHLITYQRPSLVQIYCHHGKATGSSFHKKCDSCALKYYQCYLQDSQGEKTFRAMEEMGDYVLLSNRTGFQKSYLRSISDIIEVGALSFTAAAESYETTHECTMERQRLEEGYFVTKLMAIYEKNGIPFKVNQKDESCRIDLELLCEKALEMVLGDENCYHKHSCNFPGCKEGFLMADGIEKIHRRTCAAPKTAIKLMKDMPRTISSCPSSPSVEGGNRYCKEHAYLYKESCQPHEKRSRIVVTINLLDMKVSSKIQPLVNNLPDNEDKTVHIGCKKDTNVPRFSERSAGVMALIRPCGIIVDVCELLTCESPTQLFIQLLRLKTESDVKIAYFGYDRACEFEPFLQNLKRKGNDGASILLENTSYLVDRFHIKGHTRPECDINDPKCKYHPDSTTFSSIQLTNTECAEQCFSWLKKFKDTMKYMSHYKFKLFLHVIIEGRNKRTIKLLKNKHFFDD